MKTGYIVLLLFFVGQVLSDTPCSRALNISDDALYNTVLQRTRDMYCIEKSQCLSCLITIDFCPSETHPLTV